MNKSFAIIFFGATLISVSQAQVAIYDFSHAPVAQSDVFTQNGISMTVTGLHSNSVLNQNLSTLNMTATKTNILVGAEGGLGAGPFSDNELRNGAGTPALTGAATLMEISHITTPIGTKASSLAIVTSSVDSATHEGFLVYGSAGDAAGGSSTKLDLLYHGLGDANDLGHFTVNQNLLNAYSTFYVTADNGYYSSVLLGSSTSISAQAVPEPATLATLALGGIALIRRRRKA